MKKTALAVLLTSGLALSATPALANDLEGYIESINADNQTFVVQGITFYATGATDYDDGLNRFSDLQVGQKVEVDFNYRDGKHWATEIELED